ncbi:hypothetical protein THAOC_11053, partial [Thalassiosira oceanica]
MGAGAGLVRVAYAAAAREHEMLAAAPVPPIAGGGVARHQPAEEHERGVDYEDNNCADGAAFSHDAPPTPSSAPAAAAASPWPPLSPAVPAAALSAHLLRPVPRLEECVGVADRLALGKLLLELVGHRKWVFHVLSSFDPSLPVQARDKFSSPSSPTFPLCRTSTACAPSRPLLFQARPWATEEGGEEGAKMGAGQSKESPAAGRPPSPSSPGAQNPSTVEKIDARPSPSQASSDANGGGGGGCPMKNADGSYRMAGLGALLGMGGRHPKVDADEVVIRDGGGDGSSATKGPAAAAGESAPAASPADGTPSGCPVKRDGGSSGSWNIFRRAGSSGGPPAAARGRRGERVSRPSCVIRRGRGRAVRRVLPPPPRGPDQQHAPAEPDRGREERPPVPGPDVVPAHRPAAVDDPQDGLGGDHVDLPQPADVLQRPGEEGQARRRDQRGRHGGGRGAPQRDERGDLGACPAVGARARGRRRRGSGRGRRRPPGPSLTKFMGRPTDLSPKAAVKHYLLGHPLPFDRHDWTVTRTNPDGSSTDVRYVIDYYHDDEAADESEGSGLVDMKDGIGEGGR